MPELEVQLKPPESLPEKIAYQLYRLTLGAVQPNRAGPQAEPAGRNEGGNKTEEAVAAISPDFFFKTIEYLFHLFEPIYSSVFRFLSAKIHFLSDKVKAVLGLAADTVLKTGESVYLSLFPPSPHAKQLYKSGLDETTKQWVGFFIIGLIGFLISKGAMVLPPRHMVAFAIIPVCIFLIFVKPIYGLAFYSIISLSLVQNTIWNFPREIGGVPLFMGTPLLLAAILSWLFDFVRERRRFRVINDTSYLPLIGFWSCLVFSFIFEQGEPEKYFFYLVDFLAITTWLACYIAVIHIIGDSETYYKFMIYTIAGIYGYFAYKTIRMASYYGFGTDYTVTAELEGRLSDNNELAAVINMTFPLFYCLFLNQKKKALKALFLGLFVMAITAVIYTHSRAGFICLSIIGSLLFFRVMLPRTKNKLFPVALLCLILAGGSYIFSERISKRVESVMNWKTDESARRRIVSMVTAANMMKENPWTGIGIGGLVFNETIFAKYSPDNVVIRTGFGDDDYITLNKVKETYEIHNAFFALGAKAGIPALVSFIMLIIFSIVKLVKFRRQIRNDPNLEWAYNISYALELGVIVYSINAMFINSIVDGTIYIYFAMATALYNVVLKPEQRMNKGIALWVLALFLHWLYLTVSVRA
ncbi:MAG: O-antigen ligase family protein [Elusimicrobia bacterium]|nr:O-antigen ligase family protein [Elusimicrobiota bacterium]